VFFSNGEAKAVMSAAEELSNCVVECMLKVYNANRGIVGIHLNILQTICHCLFATRLYFGTPLTVRPVARKHGVRLRSLVRSTLEGELSMPALLANKCLSYHDGRE
jgi:hypothetical protein